MADLGSQVDPRAVPSARPIAPANRRRSDASTENRREKNSNMSASAPHTDGSGLPAGESPRDGLSSDSDGASRESSRCRDFRLRPAVPPGDGRRGHAPRFPPSRPARMRPTGLLAGSTPGHGDCTTGGRGEETPERDPPPPRGNGGPQASPIGSGDRAPRLPPAAGPAVAHGPAPRWAGFAVRAPEAGRARGPRRARCAGRGGASPS